MFDFSIDINVNPYQGKQGQHHGRWWLDPISHQGPILFTWIHINRSMDK